ncbi:MAG: hypothetical protein MZU84_04880, partial [Sphingobacterium sp.]|nr:hypothetical protein [Sphingobacterium sp.]
MPSPTPPASPTCSRRAGCRTSSPAPRATACRSCAWPRPATTTCVSRSWRPRASAAASAGSGSSRGRSPSAGLPVVFLPGVIHLDTRAAPPQGEPHRPGHRRQALCRGAGHPRGSGPPAHRPEARGVHPARARRRVHLGDRGAGRAGGGRHRRQQRAHRLAVVGRARRRGGVPRGAHRQGPRVPRRGEHHRRVEPRRAGRRVRRIRGGRGEGGAAAARVGAAGQLHPRVGTHRVRSRGAGAARRRRSPTWASCAPSTGSRSTPSRGRRARRSSRTGSLGARTRSLVERLRIRHATGTVLDHLYVDHADRGPQAPGAAGTGVTRRPTGARGGILGACAGPFRTVRRLRRGGAGRLRRPRPARAHAGTLLARARAAVPPARRPRASARASRPTHWPTPPIPRIIPRPSARCSAIARCGATRRPCCARCAARSAWRSAPRRRPAGAAPVRRRGRGGARYVVGEAPTERRRARHPVLDTGRTGPPSRVRAGVDRRRAGVARVPGRRSYGVATRADAAGRRRPAVRRLGLLLRGLAARVAHGPAVRRAGAALRERSRGRGCPHRRVRARGAQHGGLHGARRGGLAGGGEPASLRVDGTARARAGREPLPLARRGGERGGGAAAPRRARLDRRARQGDPLRAATPDHDGERCAPRVGRRRGRLGRRHCDSRRRAGLHHLRARRFREGVHRRARRAAARRSWRSSDAGALRHEHARGAGRDLPGLRPAVRRRVAGGGGRADRGHGAALRRGARLVRRRPGAREDPRAGRAGLVRRRARRVRGPAAPRRGAGGGGARARAQHECGARGHRNRRPARGHRRHRDVRRCGRRHPRR